VVVRPSGTEPKLKAYVEVVQAVPESDHLAAIREQAATEVQRLVDAVAATTGLV
jgi:phosphomannomutase